MEIEMYRGKDENIIDSCCGFYGYDHDKSGLMDCAQGAIGYHLEQKRKERQAKLKQYIKARVPIMYRSYGEH